MRTIPVLIYVAAMIWVMLPDSDRKHGYMWWLQQRIRYHRAEAQYHGQRVIDLELAYGNEQP